MYKSRLTYRKEWEQKYPWVYCNDVKEGMFCKLCQKRGNPPSTARGAWTTRGIRDWNHATEQLKEHSLSKWHRDALIHARMAEQGEQQSVLQLQCSAAAKEAEEKKVRNRAIILKLLRSIYFLAKNRLPLTTTFDQVVQLQIANGDELLQQHVEEGPRNAQYTSKFSAVMLLEAIDTWLDRKLVESLNSSSYFSVLADECVDISTTEQLSICCRWLVNGKPEEHFLTVLHITALDAATISDSMQDILAEMEKSHTYEGIFPETWKLLNIMLALPVSTASVERSFSQMKLIKTRLRNRLSDMNLEHLMKIAIEGPPLTDVDFSEILDIFKQKNRHISL